MRGARAFSRLGCSKIVVPRGYRGRREGSNLLRRLAMNWPDVRTSTEAPLRVSQRRGGRAEQRRPAEHRQFDDRGRQRPREHVAQRRRRRHREHAARPGAGLGFYSRLRRFRAAREARLRPAALSFETAEYGDFAHIVLRPPRCFACLLLCPSRPPPPPRHTFCLRAGGRRLAGGSRLVRSSEWRPLASVARLRAPIQLASEGSL